MYIDIFYRQVTETGWLNLLTVTPAEDKLVRDIIITITGKFKTCKGISLILFFPFFHGEMDEVMTFSSSTEFSIKLMPKKQAYYLLMS